MTTDPYNSDILWDLAAFAAGFGEPELALRTWDRVLAVAVDAGLIAAAWAGRAVAHAELGDHGAIKAALARVSLEEGVPFVWHYDLWAVFVMKDERNLRRLLTELQARAEQDRVYRVPLAFVYGTIGDTDKALTEYHAPLDLYSGGRVPRRPKERNTSL